MVDIQPMAAVTQKTGVPIEACVFIGSSPIRQYAEEWDLDHILMHTREAISFAVGEGLDVMYVTEDTVRSSPEHLRILLTAAVEAGAKRLCLCDTVGAAVPQGVMNLVTWVKDLLVELGVEDRVGIDWHGHRDRGLDVANTLAAVQAGATRVHGTALGVGERVGNTPMEQILVNLKLLGLRDDDLTSLPEYVSKVSKATGVPIPANAPIIGTDAFRTATGVHAAAVVKAKRKGDAWLADRVYSGVPASWVGLTQQIEIGHMSGGSNVLFYLESRGLPHDPQVIEAVLAAAKGSQRLLREDEILEAVRSVRPAGAKG
jgi:2-isopropylmalate synthase